MNIDIQKINAIAIEAGKAILEVYNDEQAASSVSYKSDNSPLTLADMRSNEVIVAGLEKAYPEIPVLSEESADVDCEVRKNWDYYWCVDPLDGTKEFINRNGEFTVNIALIHKDAPVLGVIYVPCKETLYYGDANGSFKQLTGEDAVQIKATEKPDDWVSVGSRSHADGSEAEYLSAFPVTEQLSAGSSLKFCLIAEGLAQIYYRKGPTMEWDTAAGHAIALQSGAIMQGINGEAFVYNKLSLRNPGFVCRVPFEGR
ncbi:3'(2'),5'-bisphosphate nucleotidase [Mucilaginibacter conchicola]|uniref:3'(2'),5'-bisphosphate nucleotidase CysQ n=1 Tax=Mucilaginibacter conchicola TaxID=2303333 RepID=A0A372NVW6_9SPHI|nr:3'(2'),5'-bisphosphate nucleotidase CysQ [Mucilaginibacter conchicola]RFZ94011.1 3'(2'),5'-bisphosphate nucleotidase [Mucilaginibacter conchicola]